MRGTVIFIQYMMIDNMGYSKNNTKKTVETDGLMMPDSSSLEHQVLMDLINNPDMIASIRTTLKKEMFSTPGTQKVWTVLNEMLDSGTTIDISTVGTRIDRDTLYSLINHSTSTGLETMDH